jgi:hypothetical protein
MTNRTKREQRIRNQTAVLIRKIRVSLTNRSVQKFVNIWLSNESFCDICGWIIEPETWRYHSGLGKLYCEVCYDAYIE